jgi:hypothetical protein
MRLSDEWACHPRLIFRVPIMTTRPPADEQKCGLAQISSTCVYFQISNQDGDESHLRRRGRVQHYGHGRSYGVSFRFVNHIAIAIKTMPAASDSRSLAVLIFVSRAYSK